ncbi:MAG TPA: hypothetical protein VMT53_19675 [Terriglobales bacterium]|nr:hypothetical protein [Terriglobales bacterium]
MIATLRHRFNQQFTQEKYRDLLRYMEASCGTAVQFRISETPCFLPKPLLDQMCRYGNELVRQLITPDYLAKSQRSIPAEFHVPNEAAHPLFVQVDFGLVKNASGALEPKLVELQGFPSLYAYQPFLARAYAEVFGLESKVEYFLGGLSWQCYCDLLRSVTVGHHDPENVILMEIDPLHQKTFPDFVLTEKMLGIRTVDISAIERTGKQLFYRAKGKRIPIYRIYNRAIVDELVRKDVKLSFRLNDELEVEWAGHPNWFFRMSKFSLPYLRHESVPKSLFLNEIPDKPDLYGWILKPLFSFAGLGVLLHPTLADLQAIPKEQRGDYVLQERMNFEPIIETPLGMTKAEIRIMYVWENDPVPVMTIIRMGRGHMMGVDHNKNMEWVGSSAGFLPKHEY